MARGLNKDKDIQHTIVEYNDAMAFNIFLVEKEFNVGLIDGEFPILKFWNLLDEANNKKYSKIISGKKSSGERGTFR